MKAELSPAYLKKKEGIKKWFEENREQKLAYMKQYREKNKEKIQQQNRDWKRANPIASRKQTLKVYGLTVDGYNKMFSKQKGCCAICLKHQTDLKETLHVDHCHETGKIRGLLCFRCNSMLGKCGDNTEILKSAIEYLKGELSWT